MLFMFYLIFGLFILICLVVVFVFLFCFFGFEIINDLLYIFWVFFMYIEYCIIEEIYNDIIINVNY